MKRGYELLPYLVLMLSAATKAEAAGNPSQSAPPEMLSPQDAQYANACNMIMIYCITDDGRGCYSTWEKYQSDCSKAPAALCNTVKAQLYSAEKLSLMVIQNNGAPLNCQQKSGTPAKVSPDLAPKAAVSPEPPPAAGDEDGTGSAR